MYDFITKEYRGLNESEEAGVVFGMDLKELRKELAIREQNYKEQSLKVGRDIRFPKKEKRLRKPITLESITGQQILKDFGLTKEEFLKGIFPKTFVDEDGITKELNPEFLKWIFANRNDSPEEFTEKIEKKNKEFREKIKLKI